MKTRFNQLVVISFCLFITACSGGGGGGGGSSGSSPSPSSNPAIANLSASPTSIKLGQTTQLSWSSSNASSCQASGEWQGALATSGTRLITPTREGTLNYTITCNGSTSTTQVFVAPESSSKPTVSLFFTPNNVATGQTATLSWSSTQADSCTASGAWSGTRATNDSLAISQSVAGSYIYTLTCTSKDGSATGSATLGVTGQANNVAVVQIDTGPATANGVINVPYVNVTICRPNTSICQTIDHVMLDTGSYGLRIISPNVLDSNLALPAVKGETGKLAAECAPFISGYAWGSVNLADVKIAGETASSLPIQVISNPAASYANIPLACQSTGANIGKVAKLGANGILGIGLFKHDCGEGCAQQKENAFYYECDSISCSSSRMPVAQQIANPVAAFAKNNNGSALSLPSVPIGGATSLTGSLIFGIDTQSNNKIGSEKVFFANQQGYFSTIYQGKTLVSSFLDSGSNGIFFPDNNITKCDSSVGFTGFYCPSQTTTLQATNTDGATTETINFTLVNPDLLDINIQAAHIGGHIGHSNQNTMDWGLPFFFGRTVFVAIEGASTPKGTGPYWAY